jgi:hypothetical protein
MIVPGYLLILMFNVSLFTDNTVFLSNILLQSHNWQVLKINPKPLMGQTNLIVNTSCLLSKLLFVDNLCVSRLVQLSIYRYNITPNKRIHHLSRILSNVLVFNTFTYGGLIWYKFNIKEKCKKVMLIWVLTTKITLYGHPLPYSFQKKHINEKLFYRAFQEQK